jgi:urea transporter
MLKLTIIDLIVTVAAILIIDFIRAVVVRSCNWSFCCFDMESGWLGYGEFKIAENVLALCNNQAVIWVIIIMNCINLIFASERFMTTC